MARAVRGGRDEAGPEPATPLEEAAIDRAIDEIGLIAIRTVPSTGSRRSPRWCSSPGGGAVRFQDAAQDARAVVYAGIQADPLVARAATLLADATVAQRVLARAS